MVYNSLEGWKSFKELQAHSVVSQLTLDQVLPNLTEITSLSIDAQLIDEESPSPGLAIDGIGKIKLPLLEHLNLSVNPPKNGTEEIEGSKVQFRNPAFVKWIESKVMYRIYNSVLKGSKEKIKSRLQKLLVYGVGSSSPSIAAGVIEKDNLFGYFALTLPSDFEGGEIKLSFNGKSETFSNSGQEEFQTCMIPWYAGALASISTVSKGRRLVLLYSLHWSDGMFPKLQKEATRLENAIQTVRNNASAIGYRLKASYSSVSKEDLLGYDRFMCHNLLVATKWMLPDYMVYLARITVPVVNNVTSFREFVTCQGDLGNLPDNLALGIHVYGPQGESSDSGRLCIVMWLPSQHVYYFSTIEREMLATLNEAKPMTEVARSAWLKCLIVFGLKERGGISDNLPYLNRMLDLLTQAVEDWRDLCDKMIPKLFRVSLKKMLPWRAMEVLCDELFDRDRLPMYVDTWDEIAWSIAMKEVWLLPRLLKSGYGKGKRDWTRVFMNAISLQPRLQWYVRAEEILKGSAFNKDISRPLALPILVLNFDLESELRDNRNTTRTLDTLKVFLDMILEDQYGKRDFYLRCILPKLKCPLSFPPERKSDSSDFSDSFSPPLITQTEFWKGFGDLLETNFSRSESPVVQKFMKEFRDQLTVALAATESKQLPPPPTNIFGGFR